MSSPPDTTRPTLPPIVTDVEGSRTRSAVTAPPVTTTVPSDPPLVMTVPHIILEVPSEAPSDPVVTVISTVEDVPGKEDIGSAAAIHVSDSVGGDEDELESDGDGRKVETGGEDGAKEAPQTEASQEAEEKTEQHALKEDHSVEGIQSEVDTKTYDTEADINTFIDSTIEVQTNTKLAPAVIDHPALIHRCIAEVGAITGTTPVAGIHASPVSPLATAEGGIASPALFVDEDFVGDTPDTPAKWEDGVPPVPEPTPATPESDLKRKILAETGSNKRARVEQTQEKAQSKEPDIELISPRSRGSPDLKRSPSVSPESKRHRTATDEDIQSGDTERMSQADVLENSTSADLATRVQTLEAQVKEIRELLSIRECVLTERTWTSVPTNTKTTTTTTNGAG